MENKLNSLFVPYEQSYELYKLGFNDPCFKFYNQNNELELFDSDIDEEDKINTLLPDINDYLMDGDNINYDFCTAPLFTQAFQWIRDNHYDYNEYGWKIYDYIYDRNHNNSETYPKAELECLKKMLQMITEKKEIEDKTCKNCKHFRKGYPNNFSNACLLKKSEVIINQTPQGGFKQGDVMGGETGVHVGEDYTCSKFEKK